MLGQLKCLPLWAHPPVLILDALITGTLIWGALWLWQEYGWHEGAKAGLGEVAGGFSMLTVFFYSTFLTSVWTWIYILSLLLMRLAMALRLGDWASVDTRPGLWLGLFLGLAALALATPASLAFRTDPVSGLSYADERLCEIFPGPTCRGVAALTPVEELRLAFIMRACGTDVSHRCIELGLRRARIDIEEVARLLAHQCEKDDAVSCTRLGYLHDTGNGVPQDSARAAALYLRGCEGGDARGCTYLGWNYRDGIGLEVDRDAALRYLRMGCEMGHQQGCDMAAALAGD